MRLLGDNRYFSERKVFTLVETLMIPGDRSGSSPSSFRIFEN